METSRRNLLGAIAGVPVAAAFGTIPLPAVAQHADLFAELDALDRETARIATSKHTDAEWDHWEAWTDRVWKQIEAMPPTPENTRLKARAVWSIVNGDVSDINEGQSTCCRLVRQVITGLAAGGCA